MTVSTFPSDRAVDHDINSASRFCREMTARALERRVHTDEREARVAVVIELEVLPVREGRVATRAVFASAHGELAVVDIAMARVARRRRSGELPNPHRTAHCRVERRSLDVAVGTIGSRVSSFERIAGDGTVVEGSNPEGDGLSEVTGVAVRLFDSRLELLSVRALMAVLALLGRPREAPDAEVGMRSVTRGAGNSGVSAFERPHRCVRVVSESRRQEAVLAVAIGATVVAREELSGVSIFVTALTAVLIARIPRRRRVVVPPNEREIRGVALTARHIRVRRVETESSLGMHLRCHRSNGTRPLRIGHLVACGTLAREGREVRGLVAAIARLPTDAMERERRLARSAPRRRQDVAVGTDEPCMAAFQGEMRVVIEENRRPEGVLAVTAITSAREPVGVDVVVALDAVLIEADVRSSALVVRKAREHRDAAFGRDVTFLAGQALVGTEQLEVGVRVTERGLDLGAPRSVGHERLRRAAVLFVARSATRRAAGEEEVVESSAFADLRVDLPVAGETPGRDPFFVMAALAAVERGDACEPRVSGRQRPRHRRVLKQHPPEEGDDDRAEDEGGAGVEKHQPALPQRFPNRSATAMW